MAKKLIWKSFELHEDQAEYVSERFIRLTPAQRMSRFFEIWDMIRMFKSIKHEPNGFVLKRK